jgi:hypothetical protein
MAPVLRRMKLKHQQMLEKTYPATLQIGGVNYKGCHSQQSGTLMTLSGGTKQQRNASFQCFTGVLPMAIVRDITQVTQPLKRVLIKHVETGITYRLENEQTDSDGILRTLTCTQPEG